MTSKNFIDLTLIFIVSLFTLILIRVAYFNLENFQFAADMFRHFSTIRNIYDGIGPYEGPQMEYMFGVHTYFIFYLITPFFFIFKDPKLLLLINILSVSSSVVLIYLISKKLLFEIDRQNFISFSIAISYMFFPTLFKGYFYQPYGFQADTLATPFFLFLFYSYITNKFYLFLFFSCLTLSIKEEFLLIYPAQVILILLISYIFKLKTIKFTRKRIFFLFLIYLFFCTIILVTLSYFSKLNSNFTFIPNFWENNSFGIQYLFLILIKFIKILLPLIPIFFIFIIKSKFDKKIVIGFIFIFIACFLRIIENVVIYATPNGSPWGNLILAPIFFVLLVVIIKRFFEMNLDGRSFFYLSILSIVLISLANNYFAIPSIKTSLNFYLKNKEYVELKKEVKLIDKKIIKTNDHNYIILPEYLNYPFVKKMSYVEFRLIDDNKIKIETKRKLLKEAAYVILFKKNQEKFLKNSILPSVQLVQMIKKNKVKVFETENLLLYK